MTFQIVTIYGGADKNDCLPLQLSIGLCMPQQTTERLQVAIKQLLQCSKTAPTQQTQAVYYIVSHTSQKSQEIQKG